MSVNCTQGPWKWSNDYHTVVVAADGFPVATVEDTAIATNWTDLGIEHWSDAPGRAYIERSEAEQQANGRLLAAAPDLLEACQKALAFWDRYIDRVAASESWARSVRDTLRAAIARAEGNK